MSSILLSTFLYNSCDSFDFMASTWSNETCLKVTLQDFVNCSHIKRLVLVENIFLGLNCELFQFSGEYWWPYGSWKGDVACIAVNPHCKITRQTMHNAFCFSFSQGWWYHKSYQSSLWDLSCGAVSIFLLLKFYKSIQ